MAMKRLTLLILGSAMICSVAAARDADSEFKAFMKALLPRLEKAFETKNVKFFEDISTADFQDKMGPQKMTKAQSMAEMRRQFKTMKSMDCSFKLVSTKVTGNTAVSLTHSKATMITLPEGNEKSHVMKAEMWEKETWVKVGKTWKIRILEQAKPMKMWMDGKPFDPAKMGG